MLHLNHIMTCPVGLASELLPKKNLVVAGLQTMSLSQTVLPISLSLSLFSLRLAHT